MAGKSERVDLKLSMENLEKIAKTSSNVTQSLVILVNRKSGTINFTHHPAKYQKCHFDYKHNLRLYVKNQKIKINYYQYSRSFQSKFNSLLSPYLRYRHHHVETLRKSSDIPDSEHSKTSDSYEKSADVVEVWRRSRIEHFPC